MYQFKDPQDTIVAIATPSGQGGIGIVRLSGPDAITIADQMFVAKSKRRAPDLKNFMVHYGWAVDPASNRESPDIIDEVLMTIMRSPQSYTCEDVVEFNCHGGMVVLKTLVATAIHHGARLAEPGEFTKRAFLNGRIDLTQAEAVLDIIQSKTESFLRVSTHQLKGELSTELEKIREELLLAYTEIEAIVNFPEDDIDAQGKQKLQHEITSAKHQVDRLLASSTQGRILREGIRIVICGKPNVGKSSLLNVLLKTPRAIVSQIAGTTRDTIEETAQIRGIPIQLIDTAGILEPRDLIEEEAIKRSHQSIQGADLVLLVLDGHEHASAED
ncbi:MAG: tRNA uridine-5-carboxymethylaminomethyl(34) synthesis GTPase MnmE, partial [Candidatus Omnitrophota bacterium]|nr:tRNA uridine-5-carboxymethylaminomethyl(34) synthesis GTPase MnmE [Candidatus Omnitrophota bacterium]